MNFTATNPVINSFAVHANWAGKNYPNQIWYDSGNGIIVSGIFDWSVAGADRYELWSGDIMLYSGTATSFTMNPYAPSNSGAMTLKAFNGGAVSTTSITPVWVDQFCSASCSGS